MAGREDQLRSGPSLSGKGMSAGDYVSERLTQQAIQRLLQGTLPAREHKKYTEVMVPLINEAFGTEYSKMRPPSDPSRPQQSFHNFFLSILSKKEDSDLGGVKKEQISKLVDKMINEVYPSIPQDYFYPPGRDQPDPFKKKVCIIGAGAAGLYTAMILDDFGIEYEILEAADRIGGRIFTKNLEAGPTGKHDYFDVGAMRYPDIDMMARTFDLFDKLDLKKGAGLIPYHLHGPNNPMFFNNKHSPDTPTEEDYFGMGEGKGGVVPDRDIATGFKALLENAYRPFKEEFRINGNRLGWKKLSEFDMYSTRAYLALEEKYSPEVIEWCENMNVTAGLFDQAFSESVIRSIEFDKKDIKWWCIEGGSKVFIDRMQKKIKYKPITRKRVTSIELDEAVTPNTMKVRVQDEDNTRIYSHVISSVPLSCLRCVDLSKAQLTYDQHVAIRSLGYDSSVKVGIKFKSPWWRKSSSTFPNISRGGYGLTDGIIGLCVYPSYGLDDPIDEPAVMIASYTLSQDARRIGALSKGKDTIAEHRLIDLILNDLAKLHNLKYKDLKEEMLDHYAHDWYRDENAMGAFALFGPGQFGNSYPSLLKPAGKGKLNFIGEAVSRQHGWVSGSLNSAWRGVDNIFNREGDMDRQQKLRKDWGVVQDLSEATLNLSVLIGSRGDKRVLSRAVGR